MIITVISLSHLSGTMVVSWVSSAFSETLHTTKHVAHVCLLLIVVGLFEVGAGGLWGGTPTTAAYPPLVTLLFQLLRLLPLLALPQVWRERERERDSVFVLRFGINVYSSVLIILIWVFNISFIYFIYFHYLLFHLYLFCAVLGTPFWHL